MPAAAPLNFRKVNAAVAAVGGVGCAGTAPAVSACTLLLVTTGNYGQLWFNSHNHFVFAGGCSCPPGPAIVFAGATSICDPGKFKQFFAHDLVPAEPTGGSHAVSYCCVLRAFEPAARGGAAFSDVVNFQRRLAGSANKHPGRGAQVGLESAEGSFVGHFPALVRLPLASYKIALAPCVPSAGHLRPCLQAQRGLQFYKGFGEKCGRIFKEQCSPGMAAALCLGKFLEPHRRPTYGLEYLVGPK